MVVSQCDLGIYRDGSRGFEALEFRGKVREALRLLISGITLILTADWKSAEKIVLSIQGRVDQCNVMVGARA